MQIFHENTGQYANQSCTCIDGQQRFKKNSETVCVKQVTVLYTGMYYIALISHETHVCN